MKKLTRSFLLLVTLLMSLNTLADRPLSGNTGTIDSIDHKRHTMVINDTWVAVDKKVKVHSEFVYNDYFSRLKKGMKIKFKSVKQDRNTLITEIWVQ